MSDLHVTADSLAANDLRHAVDQINATPGLSFVIVSGDFTDYGDDASLRKAKAILDGLKLKYYVTSGNHETKWSESGATAFGRIFRFRPFPVRVRELPVSWVQYGAGDPDGRRASRRRTLAGSKRSSRTTEPNGRFFWLRITR